MFNMEIFMKKKLPIIITAVLAIVLIACILSACTESFKQKHVETVYSESIQSNGGMAVVYGNYLYFINGYAGESADNTFGKVVKGAIARVDLVDGKPSGDAQIIVPKNAYSTDKEYGGLYISGDYIYYATTSTDLNGSGDAKTDHGVIMRTKVDGTGTTVVKKFDDHSFVFRVAGDKLVYIRENAIYSIDLNSKKFDETTVEEKILSSYLIDDNYIYYLTNNGDDTSDQIAKVYPLAGGEAKAILSAELFGNNNVKYTLSILSAIDEGDSVRLYYTKKDSEVNSAEEGVYSYLYAKSDFAFNKANEKRLTQNSNSTTNLAYTKFFKAGNYYLGFASSKLDAFNAEGVRVEGGLDRGSSFAVYDIEETADAVYLWYTESNVLYKIQLMAKDGDNYAFVEKNATKAFSASYATDYVSFDKIGDVVYYFNSNISNNAYYHLLSDTDTASGKILGKITEEDVINAF